MLGYLNEYGGVGRPVTQPRRCKPSDPASAARQFAGEILAV